MKWTIRICVILIAACFLFGSMATIFQISPEVQSPMINKGSVTETENPLNVLVEGLGEFDDDGFGWNISCAGDVNNDGRDDIIVGAPFFDVPGQQDAGCAYIFFGKADWTSENLTANHSDVRILGEDAFDHFGWDASFAGDLNGDGVDDVVIGAPHVNTGGGGGVDRGRAYIYYGGTGFGTGGTLQYYEADEILTGASANAYLGFSVDYAGDVNDDTFDDVIIGAPGDAYSRVRFGWDSVTRTYITPDASDPLWDDTPATANYVDFNSLLNTSNTFAPDNNPSTFTLTEEDGWDWSYDWQFENYRGDVNSSHVYGPQNDTGEGLPWDTSSRLLAVVGPTLAGDDGISSINADIEDSCAWGVQINITNTIYTAIQGKNVYLEFDWEAFDTAQTLFDASIITVKEGTDHDCYVMGNFFRNGSDRNNFMLGQNLDGFGFGWYGNPEIFHADNSLSGGTQDFGWNNATGVNRMGTFSQDVSGRINGVDQYYLVLGVKLLASDFGGGGPDVTVNQGIGAYFDNVSMYYTNTRPNDVFLTGSNDFGWDVAGGGDIDNDGIDDVIVSDPNPGIPTSLGDVFVFRGDTAFADTTAGNANSTIQGATPGSLFGWSIDLVGDVNNDGFDDILIGAPGEDKSYISYGKTDNSASIILDRLWDDDPTTPGIVDFELEANNTDSDINTWGIYSPPGTSWDGWDWAENVYNETTATGDYVSWFSPNEASGGPDVGADSGGGVAMIIDDMGDDTNESAAWGCQFNLTPTDYALIGAGYSMYLEFDYWVQDQQNTGEPMWIKARIGQDNDSMWYLGDDLDGVGWTALDQNGGSLTYTFNDPTPEIWHYHEYRLGWETGFGTQTGQAFEDVTANITGSGTYYFDFGLKMESKDMNAGGEGIAGWFWDVALTAAVLWELDLDVTIVGGGVNESFGHSVAGLPSFNQDQFADFIIGAPYANNTNGINAGATYIFNGAGSLGATINAETANYINYGNDTDMCYGFAVGNAGTQTGTMHNPGVGNPRWWNATYDRIGQAQVLGIPTNPVVTITHPNGGEVVSGDVTINATATDPQGDISAVGVGFEIQADGAMTWTSLGADPTGVADLFQFTFDSKQYPDGDYWVKASVADLLSNTDTDTSDGNFTIDNLWEPNVRITLPTPADNLNGTVDLSADAFDSAMDLVLGLDYATGMEFYYRLDNVTDPWTPIGVDNVTAAGNTWGFTGWNISALPDGVCYLNATIHDIDGVPGYGYTTFNVQNPQLFPVVNIFNPWNESEELKGPVTINATVYDANEDIPGANVKFFYSKEGAEWVEIGTGLSARGMVEYYQTFDSTAVDDGLYAFRVEATDDTSQMSFDETPQFMVHNNVNNPPIVHVIYPNGGEEFTSSTPSISIRASVVDLENNIDTYGAIFSYSKDKENWTVIGNDNSGVDNIYEVPWTISAIEDGFYWIKVNATDTDGNVGEDTTNSTILIHNKLDNRPTVLVNYPNGGEVLSGTNDVVVWAYDFELNIRTEGVVMYYSDDAGETWNVLDSQATHTNNYYTVSWDTTQVPDGDQYLINATATDITSLTGFDTSNATFTIRNLNEHPPTVTLIEPLAGATLIGEVNVSATASDMDNDIDGGVSFSALLMGETDWIDIGTAATPVSGNTYTITWDTNTTDTPNGDYIIRADVVDLTGLNASDMLGAAIIIKNPGGGGGGGGDNDPKVEIVSPEQGDTINGTTDIVVTVTDEDEDLEKIEFFYDLGAGEMLIGTITDFSDDTYTMAFDTSGKPDGTYTIIVRATDAEGNIVEESFTVIVDNTDEPQPDDDDDDDTEESIFAKLWWLWVILAIIILLVIIIIIVLVMRKKNVEIQIGPFELFGKPAEGRVVIIYEGKEYASGTDSQGIAHITGVDKDLMGKDATIRAEFADKDYEFTVMLEDDKVIPPPGNWSRSHAKPEDDEKELPPKAETVKDEDGGEAPEGDAPDIAHPEDDDTIGIPPEEEVDQLEGAPGMKALPPGEKPDEIDEEDIDLDEDAPDEMKEPEVDEELPEMDAEVEVSEKPEELDEDDIDLDTDMGIDDLEVD